MTYQEPLSRTSVTIAISDASDMAALGLGPEHLRDAMAEIARHLLALGARLVYGGDLRKDGFTELLFELSARHRRDADTGDIRPAIVNYFAWPAHASMAAKDLQALVSDLAELAEIRLLDRSGQEVAIASDEHVPMSVDRADWAEALTAMRDVLTVSSDARVVLGGRVHGFMGSMPGIAEEALASLRTGRPLFLLGGFGGCARDIGITVGLLQPAVARDDWPGRALFQGYDASSLNNGLSLEENRTLARTVHVDEAVTLILRGLLRLAKGREASA